MADRLRRLAANRRVRQVVAVLLSLAALALALRGVDLDQMARVLTRINWPLLALAAGVEFLAWWATAVRWRRMFAPRPTPGTPCFLWALAVTQLGNTVFPAKVGVLARILLIGESMGKTATLCTVALEKALEALTLFVAFLVAVPFLGLGPGTVEWPWLDVLASAALFAASMVAVAWAAGQRCVILRWLERHRWADRLVGPLIAALDTLEVTRRPVALAELFGWSALIWVLTVLLDYVLLLAMGISVPPVAVWVLNVALQVGARVPSLPANLGVFHYAAVLALTMFGVGQSEALGYAVVLHVLVFVVPSLLAVGYLWRTGYDWRRWRWADGGGDAPGAGR